jgi:hypothetical protein
MKGNEWHFGMKAHIGVDSRLKIVHSFAATPANVHDSHLLPELLHGEETRVWGDAAYRGKTALIRAHAPHAADFTHHSSARRKGLSERQRQAHRTKARVRARVEHPFHVVKRIFGFVKVRYRGIAKMCTGCSSTSRSQISISTGNDCYFYGRSVSRSWKIGLRKPRKAEKTRKIHISQPIRPSTPDCGPILRSFPSDFRLILRRFAGRRGFRYTV